MTGAGALDRRIVIERLTEGSQNGFGEPSATWSTFVTLWAQRRDVSDSEKVAAGQRDTARISRFTIRSSSDAKSISSLDRISCDEALWNILGVKETAEGRNRFIELTAVRDSD